MCIRDRSSAECTTIIEHAVGEAEGFEIYDVRANSAGVVWTEADILDNLWRCLLYTSSFLRGEIAGSCRDLFLRARTSPGQTSFP